MSITLELEGKQFNLDDDGFLIDVDKWDIDIAKELARRQNLELTSDHWMLITAVRHHYDIKGVVPTYQDILGRTGLRKEDMFRLFPSGRLRGAYRLAGVPKPAGDH
jgi:tRNA 2-thiouridine synthesizing protein E